MKGHVFKDVWKIPYLNFDNTKTVQLDFYIIMDNTGYTIFTVLIYKKCILYFKIFSITV